MRKVCGDVETYRGESASGEKVEVARALRQAWSYDSYGPGEQRRQSERKSLAAL
jgi:hypothetical protein